MTRLPLVLLAPALAVLLTACPDGNGDDGAGGAAPTSTTTSSPTTTTGEETSTTTTPCPPLPGGTTDGTDREPQGAPVFLGDVDVASEDCSTAVIFDLEGRDGEPGWQIEYAQPPFRQPNNEAVDVEGDAYLRVVLHNVSGVDLGGEEPRQTYTGPEEVEGEGFVVELQQVSDFEAVMEWVIGLDARRPFEVDGGPDRIVVTIGSRG